MFSNVFSKGFILVKIDLFINGVKKCSLFPTPKASGVYVRSVFV